MGAAGATTRRKDLKTLGKRIKAFRSTNEMSAKDFADKANLSVGPIAALERGKAKLLQTATEAKILKVLDGKRAKVQARRQPASPRIPSPDDAGLSEIEEAMGLDLGSSATPPLKLSMGRFSVTVEVTD